MQFPQAFSFLQEVKAVMSHKQTTRTKQRCYIGKKEKSLTLEFFEANNRHNKQVGNKILH